ncbi:MAG: hypothetical protein LAT50_10400 [Ectothiorhodospiraceae bacterium]|nr:hypothetical protein [Ectothiorhodospiraceae bacterium]
MARNVETLLAEARRYGVEVSLPKRGGVAASGNLPDALWTELLLNEAALRAHAARPQRRTLLGRLFGRNRTSPMA